MNKLILGATGATMVIAGSVMSVDAAEARCVYEQKYVTATVLNLREKATTSSVVIDRLPLGSRVEVLQEGTNGWSKVVANSGKSNEKIGYVSNQFISSVNPSQSQKPSQSAGTNKITGTYVNARSAAGTTSYARIIGKLYAGDTVTPVKSSSPRFRDGFEWREVQVKTAKDSSLVGRKVWVAIKYTNIAPTGQNQAQKPSQSAGTNKITGTYVNARSAAGTTNKVLGKLYAGDTVTPVKNSSPRFVGGLEWREVQVNTAKDSSLVGGKVWVAIKYTNIAPTAQKPEAKPVHSQDNCGYLSDADRVHTGNQDVVYKMTTKDIKVYKYNCEHKEDGKSMIIPAGTKIKVFDIMYFGFETIIAFEDGVNGEVNWSMKNADINNNTTTITADVYFAK